MNRERCANFIRDRLIYMKVATIAIWLAWMVTIGLSGFTRDIKGDPIGTDHVAFYSAAKLIDEGRGDLIYNNGFMQTYQPGLFDDSGHLAESALSALDEKWNRPARVWLDAYRNPPFYALLYVPTSRLPYLSSYWIWTAIALALLLLGLGWLDPESRWSAFVVAMSFYPIFAVFSFGQNSLLSFGALCLTYRFLQRKQNFLAGMASGLLLFKPQLLMGLGIWWLLNIRRYAWCWLGLTVTGSIWLVISFLLVPNETRVFIAKLSEIAGYTGFMFFNLHNPRAFFTLLCYDDKSIGNLLGAIFSLAAIAGFIYFWRRHRDSQPLMFAAAVFVTLWASPHTMIYEWSLALIPAILLWRHAPEQREDWLIIFAIAWVALFISTPIAKYLFEWTFLPETNVGWAIQLSVPVMGALGVWAVCALGRQKKVANDPICLPRQSGLT